MTKTITDPRAGVAFHPLRVRAVRPLTDDSVSVEFEIPAELHDDFLHQPGQHIVLRADIDGADTRRSYSLWNPPALGRASVGIRRISNGLFSTWATTELVAGDTVDVMAPIGEFSLDPTNCGGHRVMVAAGSGITPVLSMIGGALEAEPEAAVTLIYGNRTAQTIMFLEEIQALKNRFLERFQVVHVLSREPNQTPLFEGRIDADKIDMLCQSLIDAESVAGWYLCGPLDMVEDVTGALVARGVPADRVHSELFFDQRIDVPIASSDDTHEGLARTEFTLEGRTSVVHCDPAGPSLLDYARSVRSDVPFACKGGMCATCKAKVVEGDVVMDKNYALTPEEVASGYVLSCQTRATGTTDVALSFDVTGAPR